MHDQPRYEPLEASPFFANGAASRTPVDGTVARDELQAETYLYTGKVGGSLGQALPFPLTRQLLERGQERYNIYCSPCHDRVGNGAGIIVRRGFRHPPSFHQARLREAPLAHYFDVISNGFGAMMDYAMQLTPRDRWAVAAYIRALQLSQHASLDDVPIAAQQHLQDSKQ
jgi:mono/diheme cytochrome c family protein